ncbi:uncharacterized protein VTP21DRAFT_6360 [Calcarisporiella thermophila]|uniref:uncharacterized protein n=1 Tax=Calcarisporiella thermophila TaxID=911321 RepID=UPI003742EDB0
MFALRRVIAAPYVRAAVRPRAVARPFSVYGASLKASTPAHPDVSELTGPGAPAGNIPTDEQQSTGLERLELLANLQGKEFFDMSPLEMTHMGTKKNPIVVQSESSYRYIGCTGYPADSHDTLWLTLRKEHDFDRCPECGCVYKMEYTGTGEDEHHH